MSTPKTVECSDRIEVEVSATLTHLCPYADETDHGGVRIWWTTAGQTIELWELRDYLAGFRLIKASHEHLTERIREELAALDGITAVRVESQWTTAGMGVTCSTTQTPLAPESAPQ